MNGIEAARQIAAEGLDIKIIGLSMHSNRRFVEAMFQAGAKGYALKGSPSGELVSAIRCVIDNKTYRDPGLDTIQP